MTDYYMSAAGNDSNAGTSPGAAWRTFGPTYAIAWKAGDRLLLRGGDAFAGMVWVGGAAGTPLSPIVIGSYGTGRATITESGNSAIYIENCSNLVVQDLDLVGTSATYDGLVYHNTGTDRTSTVKIQRCSARGWKIGMAIGGSTATNGVDGLTVEDVDTYNNSRDGLLIYGAVSGGTYSNFNVTIRRVRAWGNTGQASYTASHSGSGIIVGCTDGGLVEDCEAWDNGANNGWSGGGPVGIWAERARSVVIRKCYSHGNLSNNGADGDGFDLDIGCVSCMIERCLSVGNAGAGVLLWGSSGSVVRHNIIIGNGTTNTYANVHIGGSDANALIYGNTVVAQKASSRTPAAVHVATTTLATKFINNVLTGPGVLVEVPASAPPSVAAFLQNLYWNGSGFRAQVGATLVSSISSWRGYGQERNGTASVGVVADPLLTVSDPGGVAVAPGSPTAGAGLDYPGLNLDPGPVDYAGSPLTTPPPIGALVPPLRSLGSSLWALFAF